MVASRSVRLGDNDPMTPAEIREWLKATMEAKDLSARGWAAKAGISQATIFRALKEDYPYLTSSRTLAKLAAAAEVAAPSFKSDTPKDFRIIPTFLAVRGKVQAGHWIEVDDYFEPPPVAMAVRTDSRYAEWPQWLEEVVGDSINKKIPEGGFAHVVSAIELGYEPREGDFVVVERRRAGGHLRERTIKQIRIGGGGRVELWPMSTNPKWSEPLVLTAGAENEEIEVQIVALVIGAYMPML